MNTCNYSNIFFCLGEDSLEDSTKSKPAPTKKKEAKPRRDEKKRTKEIISID
jgi:Stm1